MSGISLTIKALLAESAVTAIVSTRVYPSVLPLKTALPAIAVAMTAENDEYQLAGAAQFPVSTVTLHCVAGTAKNAVELGEAVKTALRDKRFSASPYEAQFRKTGVDFTDFDDTQTTHRRVMSFDIRWR